MDASRSTVAANRLRSLKEASISVSFCQGGCKFRSSAGYRKYSLASSQLMLILGLSIRIEEWNGEKEKDW